MSRLYSAAATLFSAAVMVVAAAASSSVDAFQPHPAQPRPRIISAHHRPHAASRSIIVIPPFSSSSSQMQGRHFSSPGRRHRTFLRPASSSSSTTALRALPAFDELIFNAQRAASDLAATSIPGASSAASSGGATSTALAATLTPTSLAILYFAGLLTSFSPCSISLLPLTISYISQSTGEREDKTSLLPTLAFAAGLASVFVGLGLSVALLGGVFGATTQGSGQNVSLGKIVLATLSSGVSIAMGLQLLELVRIPLPSFELDVPTFETDGGGDGATDDLVAGSVGLDEEEMGAAISFDDDGNLVPVLESASASTTTGADSTPTNKSTPNSKSSSASSSASLLRTFLLGGSSALIASPCATPVLTSILAFVASSQNPTIGAALLFTYTLGYSTPLLVVGATGGQALANAQVAAASSEDEGDGDGGGVTSMAKIGKFVTPLTASVLIWYGTTGFLEALFGDPSLAALAPIMD